MQAGSLFDQYKGINIKWKAQLFSAEPIEGGKKARVALVMENNQLIMCVVSLESNRQLAVLPKDAPVTVIGEIAEIDPTLIQLQNVELLFES